MAGRPKHIETPERMWQLFEEFREWKKSDPILVVDFVGKDGRKELVPRQRPLTLEGFSCWLFEKGVVNDIWPYFSNYKGGYEEFLGVCRTIREIIRTDQIEGGMTGIYNPSITQRLNGLVEKTETKTVVEQPLFGDTDKEE